jgi:proteasome alpha subunit
VVVLHYADGIVFVAENRSAALHKVSEIYDRIGFAAVGRLQRVRAAADRRHPVRRPPWLQLRPDRRHRPRTRQRVRAAARHHLLLGGEKPYEVEIVVAELGAHAEQDQIYRLTYDGSVADENNFAVMAARPT